ncbi:DUF2147 domain-containing protein [Acetobacter tropicalis]|uniref:DUF2147 domain-containing protein n=1 Tax=Acetobacter TaxID=434 RepID=UPI0022AAA5F2|nr:DUF2147 domain-containing protein [Acetobacter senegalensis]MCG4253018.1 DUF2147 domain-containing protein [Acetobacter senegalensis]MCG4262145.1 DUF2147 domain-containing protein [Acetobacter senegalensis]
MEKDKVSRKNRWLAAFLYPVLICAFFIVSGTAQAESVQANPFEGYWLSQGHDGVFKIGTCGDTVCGHLVGLQYEGTDVPRDKKGNSECNLLMLTDFRASSDEGGRWNGKILDPDTGSVYQAQIWSPRKDVLKLRGYIGLPLFGETQTWTRYQGTIGPVCKMPH